MTQIIMMNHSLNLFLNNNKPKNDIKIRLYILYRGVNPLIISVCGLVVEYVPATDETWVRFPPDAFLLINN